MALTIYGDLNLGQLPEGQMDRRESSVSHYDWVAGRRGRRRAPRAPAWQDHESRPPRCRPWCWPTGGRWPSPTPSSCTWREGSELIPRGRLPARQDAGVAVLGAEQP